MASIVGFLQPHSAAQGQAGSGRAVEFNQN